MQESILKRNPILLVVLAMIIIAIYFLNKNKFLLEEDREQKKKQVIVEQNFQKVADKNLKNKPKIKKRTKPALPGDVFALPPGEVVNTVWIEKNEVKTIHSNGNFYIINYKKGGVEINNKYLVSKRRYDFRAYVQGGRLRLLGAEKDTVFVGINEL